MNQQKQQQSHKTREGLGRTNDDEGLRMSMWFIQFPTPEV